MSFQLNPALAAGPLRRQLDESGRLKIASFLEPEGAAALAGELRASPDWKHVIKGGEQVFETTPDQLERMPEAERKTLDEAVYRAARSGFQYRYDTIRVPDALAEREARPDLLAAFARFMSSEPVLDWVRDVTGRSDIAFADAQATRYRAGDFLTRHDDNVHGKDRTHAYVFSLTPDWLAEWGGLLLFNDADGGVAETFVPAYNALHLFAIGQPHSVSFVAPYAAGDRISVTGWFRTKAP